MDDPRPPLYEQLAARIPRIPATWLLIIANLLVFAAMLGQGAGLRHTDNAVQLAWGANFGPATKDGEWWRLGSALFLHFGLLHLALNMLSLWDGGRLVERMYGHGRFLVLFFAAGLAGNLLSLIAQGDRAISGGASGAVFGVYGALLSFLWLERRQLHPGEFRRLFVGAALFSAINIGLGFQVTGIDNAAHIGGFVAGILAGAALAPSAGPRPGAPPPLASAAGGHPRPGRGRPGRQHPRATLSLERGTAGPGRNRPVPGRRRPPQLPAGAPSSARPGGRGAHSTNWPAAWRRK
jgi:rhomboid protease GluP